MRRMRQMHGRMGFATVYACLVIFRDDRRMFRSRQFPNKASVIADLFRATAGIVLTAMAAPLILSVFLFGQLLAYYPMAPIIVGAAFMVGLSISAAAALLNAVVVSLLARFRIDALPISLTSGGLVGLWARTVIVQGRTATSQQTAAMSLHEFIPFGATGALMGGLYWLIAILPQRRRRRAHESVSSQSLDQAVQDTIKRRRGRRIPWDGRVPPD
jgi:hypothetical protein